MLIGRPDIARDVPPGIAIFSSARRAYLQSSKTETVKCNNASVHNQVLICPRIFRR